MYDHTTSEVSDGFCIIPPELRDDVSSKKLKLMDLHVYIILRSFWGGYPKIFPKVTTIAEKSGYGESAVEKALASLKKHGWIMSERQKISHGQNRYWICNKPFQLKPSKESK